MLKELIYQDLMARGRTEAVAREWGAVAEDFEEVCGCKCVEIDPEEYGKKYARADLTLYLTHLRKRELAQSTINKNLKSIRLLSQIKGWDFPKLSLRRTSPDDITRTILPKDNVSSMILMGKSLFTKPELCYLALSTTYGLRRSEMVKIEPHDLTQETITIHTTHGGKPTTQLVPPEIAPYLQHYKHYEPDSLTHMFHRLAQKTGLTTTTGFGWHSIRRSLATELILLDASALNVLRFMRWSDASSARGGLGMLTIYAKRDQARIDQAIFNIHPFLPFWREA
ncbi:hypothetical protein ES703_10276 [subsurface metagenome]